jgi:uncharacterized protein YciI
MLYAFVMHDRADGREIRAATVPAHSAWVGEHTDVMYVGGPLTNDGGDIIGSLIIGDFADRSAAAAFIAAEPYNCAGLFESVIIRRFDARIERGASAAPFTGGT